MQDRDPLRAGNRDRVAAPAHHLTRETCGSTYTWLIVRRNPWHLPRARIATPLGLTPTGRRVRRRSPPCARHRERRAESLAGTSTIWPACTLDPTTPRDRQRSAAGIARGPEVRSRHARKREKHHPFGSRSTIGEDTKMVERLKCHASRPRHACIGFVAIVRPSCGPRRTSTTCSQRVPGSDGSTGSCLHPTTTRSVCDAAIDTLNALRRRAGERSMRSQRRRGRAHGS